MKKQPTTSKLKAKQKDFMKDLKSIADTIEDPDFSMYSDDTEEAHTIKPVTGRIPTYQDNW
jgi:hypothetical protein